MSLGERAKNYCLAMTNVDIAVSVMAASLLVCAWLLFFVGFVPPSATHHLYSLGYHVAYPLLLILPVSLALALRTLEGVVLAISYLAPIVWNLFENFLARREWIGSLEESRLFIAAVIIYGVPLVFTYMLRKSVEPDKTEWSRVLGATQMLLLLGAVLYFTFR